MCSLVVDFHVKISRYLKKCKRNNYFVFKLVLFPTRGIKHEIY